MAGEWKLINETVDAQCEDLASRYERSAKQYRTLAKESADKGCHSHNYEHAFKCAFHAESLENLASSLRAPQVAQLIMEPRRSPDADCEPARI